MKQNFIELITVPFNAGESKLFAISGQYFELIDATNPIDVLLSDVNGAQRGVMRSAEASFNLKDTDFATVQLYSPTTQTIRFAYGTGEAGTRRAAGAVSIVGTVPVSGPLTDAQLRAALVGVQLRPELPSAVWSNSTVVAANTPLTVFAPGDNVNGAIIWQAESSDTTTSAYSPQTLIAKATAPTSFMDGEAVAVGYMASLTGTAYATRMQLQQPVRIAAGLGLYFISTAAGSASGARVVRYTLL